MSVSVRPFEQDDLDTVLDLWRRARMDSLPWLEARMGHTPDDDRWFFTHVVLEENQIRVATEGGAPRAFLAMAGSHINYLYVDPDHQRRGIGTLLLDAARSASPEALTLKTHQRNARARAFYEQHGFEAVAFGISDPPESEPDVTYRWQKKPI